MKLWYGFAALAILIGILFGVHIAKKNNDREIGIVAAVLASAGGIALVLLARNYFA